MLCPTVPGAMQERSRIMIRIQNLCALVLALFLAGCNVDAQTLSAAGWPDPAPGSIADGNVEMYN